MTDSTAAHGSGTLLDGNGKLARLRAQLPATAVSAYLNAGTNGPIPVAAHRALVAAAEAELSEGRIGPDTWDTVKSVAADTRTRLAELLGAEPASIALMRNTTEGLNAALMGVAWRPGDEVVTTQLEHICLFSLLGMVAHRHRVIVRTVDIGDGGGDVTGALQGALTTRTRAIAISHVQWSTGAVMPLADIAQLARNRGVLTVIDAAQGPGHVPVDLDAFEVDVYALAGQKWLCGPSATGALFVRPDRIGDIRPTYLRSGAFDPHGFVVPAAGAQRYETGEHALPTLRAQQAALRWLRDEAGYDWLLNRNALLGRRLAEGLGSIDGVHIRTPLHRMAGIVCFTVEGISVHDVVTRAYASGYTLRAVNQRPGPTVVRASTGWWCTEAEIDGLIEVVAGIARTAST